MSATVMDSKQTDCCESNLTLSLALESNKQTFIPKPANSALPVCASQKCFFLKILTCSFFATSPQLQEVPPKRQQSGGL